MTANLMLVIFLAAIPVAVLAVAVCAASTILLATIAYFSDPFMPVISYL